MARRTASPDTDTPEVPLELMAWPAFDRGVNDQLDGLAHTDNPHEPDSHSGRCWARGWHTASTYIRPATGRRNGPA